jgi:hypothetical protein
MPDHSPVEGNADEKLTLLSRTRVGRIKEVDGANMFQHRSGGDLPTARGTLEEEADKGEEDERLPSAPISAMREVTRKQLKRPLDERRTQIQRKRTSRQDDLTDTLGPLPGYPIETIKAEQVGHFINVATGTGNIVSIRSRDFWINGTNILKEAGLKRKAIERVWRNLRRSDIPMEYGLQGIQHNGMFLEFEEGLKLCDRYNELAPLKELLQRTKEVLTLQTTGGHGLKGDGAQRTEVVDAPHRGGGHRGQDDQERRDEREAAERDGAEEGEGYEEEDAYEPPDGNSADLHVAATVLEATLETEYKRNPNPDKAARIEILKKLAPLKELLQRTKEGLAFQTTSGHGLEGNHERDEEGTDETDEEDEEADETEFTEISYDTQLDGNSTELHGSRSSCFTEGNFSNGSFLSQSSLYGSESNCVTYDNGPLGIPFDSSWFQEELIR